MLKTDETKALREKLRFLGSLKSKLKVPWKPKIESSNYRIFTTIKTKHLYNYENISKFLGERLGQLVNKTAGIPYYIK